MYGKYAVPAFLDVKSRDGNLNLVLCVVSCYSCTQSNLFLSRGCGGVRGGGLGGLEGMRKTDRKSERQKKELRNKLGYVTLCLCCIVKHGLTWHLYLLLQYRVID